MMRMGDLSLISRERGRPFLKLNKHLLIVYAFIAYVSWQLHELGHWVACQITGVDAILGLMNGGF